MAEIILQRFSKSFGSVQVLHDVDLVVRDGEFVVLLGPSGCGKSTLLRMIAGLEDPSAGMLWIDGVASQDRPARDRDVAMVFQSYALYPHMTVHDNMAFGLRRLGLAREEIERRVRSVAAMLAIESLLGRLPRELSGGQQQRVAMGRAMVKTPKVFLFDEPLSNLDATLRDQLRIEIRKLHKRLKTTTLFVTHDQIEAMTLADRIVVLRDGRIEQVGTPAEIYDEPRTVFVSRFVGSPRMNLIEARVLIDDAGGRLEGDGLVVPLPPSAVARLRTGQRILLGIRPKDIEIATASTQGAIQGSVVLSETLGAEKLVQVAVGGTELSLLAAGDARFTDDDIMHVTFRPNRLHLFDAATELRLA